MRIEYHCTLDEFRTLQEQSFRHTFFACFGTAAELIVDWRRRRRSAMTTTLLMEPLFVIAIHQLGNELNDKAGWIKGNKSKAIGKSPVGFSNTILTHIEDGLNLTKSTITGHQTSVIG